MRAILTLASMMMSEFRRQAGAKQPWLKYQQCMFYYLDNPVYS